MAICLHIFGQPTIWPSVLDALRDYSEPDIDLSCGLADTLAREGSSGVQCIQLPHRDGDYVHNLVSGLSERVPESCQRLSECDEEPGLETLSLYHSGQRLARRTVA